MLKFVHLVDLISLPLSWDGRLYKQLSLKDVSWGIGLLCNVDFISSWAPWCSLPEVSLAVISECRHSAYCVQVRPIVSTDYVRVGHSSDSNQVWYR